MTTFEALGEQYGNRRKAVYNTLIVVLVVAAVFATSMALITLLNSSKTDVATGSTYTPVTTQESITFPVGSDTCLQNCHFVNYQVPSTSVQAVVQGNLQPAVDVQ